MPYEKDYPSDKPNPSDHAQFNAAMYALKPYQNVIGEQQSKNIVSAVLSAARGAVFARLEKELKA